MTIPRVRWVPAALLVAVAVLAAVSPLSAAERAKDRILRVTSTDGWADMRSLVSALFGALGKSGNTLDPNGSPTPGTGGAGTLAPFAVQAEKRIQEREPCEREWLLRLRVDAWAHLASALRVSGDLQEAGGGPETGYLMRARREPGLRFESEKLPST